ncbi:MAG: hypothetical protein R3E83_22305 [Burkholderiaceae bacterium]
MPLEELAKGLVAGIFRIVGEVLVEGVFERLFRGAGYAICRRFKPKVDPDGWVVLLVGVGFWLGLGWLAVSTYLRYAGG